LSRGLLLSATIALFGGTALVAQAQPDNDDFDAAEVITGPYGTVIGDNTEATSEFGEPNHAGNVAESSLWYTWTAPQDGEVTMDTIGSTGEAVSATFQNGQIKFTTNTLPLDTVLAVYTGTNLASLRQIAANDDTQASLSPYNRRERQTYQQLYTGPSVLRFTAKAGTTYYIALDSKFSYKFAGNFSSAYVTTGSTMLNWAYHSSGVFRFASEDFDLEGSMDGTTPPTLLPLYRAAEFEGRGGEDASTFQTYYTYGVPGVLVTVTRVAGSSGRMLVNYYTEDRTATTTNGDYQEVYGTLVFDDYEMSKSILIPIGASRTNAWPNREFAVILEDAEVDPFESDELSPPRVDNVFGTALVRILDMDIDPVYRRNLDTNGVFVGPTNSVFNFSRVAYRSPEDVGDYWTNGGIWVVRGGTNTEGLTLQYRINNYFLGQFDVDEEDNNVFPLQAGSDYATPRPPNTDYIRGSGPDFTLNQGSIAFGANDFRDKHIKIAITNDDMVEFNEDFHVFLYWVDSNGNAQAKGTVNETCYTILFDDRDAPAGSVDEFFNADYGANMAPAVLTSPPQMAHPGTDGVVYSLVTQPDGKSIIGGSFFAYNLSPRNCIARLGFDGSLDPTFNPGNGANDAITSLALTSGGQVYIGGSFTSYNGIQRTRLARVNSDGSLDASFNVGTGPGATIWATLLQNDGKIIAAGEFTSVNGFSRLHIARFNPDGSLDQSFDPGTNGPNDTIWSAVLQTDGKVLIGGDFTTVGGLSRNHVARLNADGTVDTTFDPGTGTDGTVFTIALGVNSKIWIGGGFTTANLAPYSRFARLNADGSLDASFDPGTGADDTVYSIAPQADGTVYVGGIFTTFNGTHRLGFTRLFSDGTVDTGFLDTAYNQYAGLHKVRYIDVPGVVFSSSVQPDGKVLIAGQFSQVGGGQADINIRMDPNDFYEYTNNVWSELKARDGVRNRSNIARLLGGSTSGPGNVGFNTTNYTASEAQGFLSVALTRSNGTLGFAAANFQVLPGLIQPGPDFGYFSSAPLYLSSWRNPLPASIGNAWTRMVSDGLFGPNTLPIDIYGDSWFGYTNATVSITLPNDSIIQGNRGTTIQLANPSGADIFYLGGENIPLCAALGHSKSPFTIIDDDHQPGTITFASSNFTVNEAAGTATITLVRTNGSFGTVQISYGTYVANDTNYPNATPGSDYNTVSGSKTFGNGQTSVTFTVPIINDSIAEDDEVIGLRIFNPTGGATAAGTNALLTIIDNDSPSGRLNFVSTTYATNENAGAATITLKRSGGSQGTVKVWYKTINGTASSGTDYSGVTNVLTWNAGDTANKSFTVPLLDNLLVDGNRTVNLQLSSPTINNVTNYALFGPTGPTTLNSVLTILDDDAYGSLAFSAPTYSVNENGGPAVVTIRRASGVAQSATLNFSTVDFTAHAGSDYVATNGVLVFAPNELSKSFNVALVDNPTVDGPRAIALQLSGFAPGTAHGLPDSALVNIVDDEAVNEPAGSPDTGLDPSLSANGDIFALALEPDGGIVLGGDFTILNNAFRNRIGRLNSDGSLDRAFAASVSGADNSVRALISQTDSRVVVGGAFTNVNGVNRNHYARLNSDGTIDTSFNPGSGADNTVFALAETFMGANGDRKLYIGGAFLTVNGSGRARIARLNTDGSVDAGFDPGQGADGPVFAIAVYPTNSVRAGQLLIAGSFTAYNGVSRPGIARLNANGSLDLTFDPGAGASDSVRALALQADERILAGGLFTNFNGSAAGRIVRLTATGSVDPGFNTGAGANEAVFAIALQSDNRIVLAGQFTTANGITRHSITRLNTDGSADPQINFGLGADSFIAALAIQPADQKILIGGGFTHFDEQPYNHFARLYGRSINGSGLFEFTSSTYSVQEDGTNVVIGIRRRGGTSGCPSGNVSVTFSTSDGTAIAGNNYVAVITNVVFPPGEVFQIVPLTIVDDHLVNSDRTVNLTLSNPLPGGCPDLGGQSAATLTIINDDSAISFSAATYSRNENAFDGVATIPILRTGSVSGSSSVDFVTTTNGTAVAGVNYLPLTNTVTFVPGQTSNTVRVPVLYDAAPNGNKTVGMLLTNEVGSILLDPSQATLTIIDIDHAPGQFDFSTNSYFVGEGNGFGTITVIRTNGSSGVVSVQFATTNGTAIAGLRYAPTNGVLTFADNVTSQAFQVRVIDDAIVQGPQSLGLVLSNPSVGTSLLSTNASLTILDNDVGLGFSSTTYAVSEGAGSVTLSIQRLNGTNGSFSVQYASSNGTASANSDYLGVSGSLTFANGETLKTINIPILQDNIVEGNETFTVSLFAVSPSNAAQLITSSTTVTILDDDAAFTFTNVVYQVTEANTNLIVTVLRTNAQDNATNTVVYFTSDGTATHGQDYVASSGVLTFSNGEVTKNIVIPILQDTIVEGNEFFTISLTNATGGAQLVGATNTTVQIVDDDAGFAFSSPTYFVGEGAINATVSVLRSGYLSNNVSVSYSTADGTATASQPDYISASGVLAFTNGETVKTFSIQVVDDNIIEGNETVLLSLSNPQGQSSIVSPGAAVLTIVDNDGSLIVPAGSALLSESGPANGAIDPSENVSLLFALRNSVGVSTVNLTATLLATNGVTGPSGPQSYGLLVPGGPSASRPFSFTASGTNGAQVTATFLLQDGAVNLGTAVFSYTLGTNVSRYTNLTAITIRDNTNALPYPTAINVANLNGVVSKATVTLTNLTHTHANDVDVLLTAPGGSRMLLLANNGGANAMNNVALTFDDNAATPVPATNSIVTGTNRPSPILPVTTFTDPAPAAPYATNLAACNGSNPNGPWSLFVLDDTPLDSGSLGGWILSLTTASVVPAAADLVVTASGTPSTVVVGSNVTYTISLVNYGPSSASNVALTNVLPATFGFVSASIGGWVTNANVLTFTNLGTLAKDGATSITVVAKALVLGSFTNLVTAVASENDPFTGDNTVSVPSTVVSPSADLALAMFDAPSPVSFGNNLVYTLVLSNLGPATATSVSLTNTLPPGVAVISATPSGYALSGSTLVFTNLGNLGNGGSVSAQITVKPGAPGLITNSAVVASTILDPLKANNSASVKTVVQAAGISAARIGNNLVLSWPADAGTYVLESSTSLQAPIVWSTVSSPPPQAAGGVWTVALPTTNARSYFRLRQTGP